MTEHQHRGLDELADVLAAESDGTPVPVDLATCSACSASLTALRKAVAAVAVDLGRLPAVPDVPSALDRSVVPSAATTATNVLPEADVASLDERRRAPRWLWPAAGLAAAAVVVVGGGLLLTHNATDSASNATSAAPASTFPISETGTHYGKATLPTAIPGLLKAQRSIPGPEKDAAPSRGAALPDPLAMLHTPAGLAACLAGLTEGATGLPLALDYASWGTRPALVVVLPASRASKVDVFVVGANCTKNESDLIYYLRANRP